jgi:hypothetical protein
MAITLPTAKHVQAQHAGVTGKSVNPSKTNPASGVHSVPVVSDMGELGGLLFGHTVADNVTRTETGTTARQTELGGFVPKAKTTLTKTKATVVGSQAAHDPGAVNRTTATAQTQANQIRAAARRQANNLLAAARRQANKLKIPTLTAVGTPPQGNPPSN